MKNYTFKVFPAQNGLDNTTAVPSPESQPLEEVVAPPEMTCPPSLPCPSSEQGPRPPACPLLPCPPMMPGAPLFGAPGMPPGSPFEPCPSPFGQGGPGLPFQAPVPTAPPFMCPYFRLAHAYVPWQFMRTVFSPAEGLAKGTIFPELYMPQGQYGPCEGPKPCRLSFGGGVPCEY